MLPGQEVCIYRNIVTDGENGELPPLVEGEYMFIEFPSNHIPRYTEQLLFDIQMQGLTPIIVTPRMQHRTEGTS